MEVVAVNSKDLLRKEAILKRKNILIYVSKEDEVDTINLILELFKLKKNIYVPKVEKDIINFYQINSLFDLKLGKFNILEPISKIKITNYQDSVIIVPGLLFDLNNNRLGYGGGYYDKFLQDKNIYKIGICYSFFKIDKINSEKHDIKMDLIITEE